MHGGYQWQSTSQEDVAGSTPAFPHYGGTLQMGYHGLRGFDSHAHLPYLTAIQYSTLGRCSSVGRAVAYCIAVPLPYGPL